MADKLAALGGTPVVEAGSVRPWPHITDEDRKAVADVLAGEDLGVQRQAQEEGLAKDFAECLGVKHVVPVNSGTAALHCCVAGIGIEPGDEVICPAFTYWATAAAVLHHNGIPVFVDVEPDTWTLDPGRIEERITDRTRALLPVHIHGMPADMDPIKAIAKKHDLYVLEDCAQSHGATYKGGKCGALGDAAGFSSQASKLLTTGSYGGLFATNDDVIAERAKLLQYLGEIVVPGRERQMQKYNAYGLGWMYRGDVMGQAFIRSQLRRLDQNNALRAANCELLTELLADMPGVLTPIVPEGRGMAWYTYTVRFDPQAVGLELTAPDFRARAERALQAEGVPVGRWQTIPVPGQNIFQAKVGYGKGCPWTCRHASHEVSYDLADYPVAQEFVDSQMYVFGVNPPNGADLMREFAAAFEKLMAQPEELLKIEM
ncbi:MAG: DegT/DnrJ/EryC1/StrS family aminotransferase [Armatimonadetes bacterium]|nr:DegT/DnrJ/EryC1/StrS family aminotransferase [Armatimonadota bacterium]